MIFVSKGYFKSKNCLREVQCTMDKDKPIALAHDSATYLSTYMPLAKICDEECPTEMLGIFRERDVIPWHRIQEFQLVSLKLLAEQLLLGCPREVSQDSIDLFIPGELPLRRMALRGRIVVYASSYNPGALSVARDLAASMGGNLEVTADPTAIATKLPGTSGKRTTVFMLLYLNGQTFLSTAGEMLAKELRTVRAEGSTVQVIMVHENDTDRGGCDFGIFFDGRTPQDLLQDGLFKDLALALYSHVHWPVSAALVANAMGATAASLRSRSSFTTASATRRAVGQEAAGTESVQVVVSQRRGKHSST